MNTRLKVMTVVGTRPEIIRLAPTLKRLDEYTDHVLVHTGQNYDYELNEVFFEDLGLRRPDHFLEADTSSLGSVLGSILVKTEAILLAEKPDAFVVLGDTNSCISALIARRLKVPVFHMEAGNRSFDENVPEETNRRLVDHVADYNLVYTEHARRNLLAEGIHPSRILLTGSPMREVLEATAAAIDASDVLSREGLLQLVRLALARLAEIYGCPVMVSTHPRTRNRLEGQPDELKAALTFHPPFGFNDYVKLQKSAKMVISDSGTISEESSLLQFPAVTIRDFIERPESIDTGSIVTTGVGTEAIVDAVDMVLKTIAADGYPAAPADYRIDDTSRRVVSFIRSTAHSHKQRTGIRA
jgi:UDP-N-acetylglucosamine 2-epimerase